VKIGYFLRTLALLSGITQCDQILKKRGEMESR
jgi:hypothetical protein